MKIGVDVRGLLNNQITGVGEYTFNLLKALLAAEASKHYVLFSSSFAKALLPEEFLHNHRIEHRHLKCPNKLFNVSLKFFELPRLDKLIGPVDVFWFPNLNFWSVSSACPTVVTVHDLSFEKLPWAYSIKRRLWHHAIKPGKKLNQATVLAAVSQNTKHDLIKTYGLPSSKIEVVYPALPDFYPGQSATVDKELVLPDKYLLFLGTLEPRKNIESVIRAFSGLAWSDYFLIIAGGQGWLYQKIYQLVKELNLENKVRFLGYVSPEQKHNLLKQARLLIWPSFYEGFGLPPLEAMAAGVPVISSADSSLPEVLGRAALLVDPYNIQEIKEAINQAINNSDLRQNLINQGYEQVNKFSWQESADKMLKIFEKINSNARSVK